MQEMLFLKYRYITSFYVFTNFFNAYLIPLDFSSNSFYIANFTFVSIKKFIHLYVNFFNVMFNGKFQTSDTVDINVRAGLLTNHVINAVNWLTDLILSLCRVPKVDCAFSSSLRCIL